MKKLLNALLFMCAVMGSAFAQTQIKHVVVIALENHEYSEVIGNTNMPYLNGLAKQGALATQFYATTHPSLPNYFRLTTGQHITDTNSYTGTVTADNIVRELTARGLTWKNYAESLPYAGYLGAGSNGYVRKHDPFAYLSDVKSNTTQAGRIVPFTQLASDLAANALPSFSFVQVNDYNNGHDCPQGLSTCTDTQKLVATDNWLLSHVPTILNDPEFKQSGLLVIWYDEGTTSLHGGGHVAVVFAGPFAKPGARPTNFYTHDNLLRTIGQIFGFHAYPGNSANAGSMTTMLSSTPTATTGVLITSPVNGSTISSPVHAAATAQVTGTISQMELWIDGRRKYVASGSTSLNTDVRIKKGLHHFTFIAINTAGTRWSSEVSATVR